MGKLAFLFYIQKVTVKTTSKPALFPLSCTHEHYMCGLPQYCATK